MLKVKPEKTLEDYLGLPQEHGVELIEGEFATSPSPGSGHQRILGNLYQIIRAAVESRKLGQVFFAPMDVVLSKRTVLQPDLLLVKSERAAIIKERIEGPPDLVVEVLSEATMDRDRFVKRDLYARYGVAEYWIVDPAARTIEALTLKGKAYELVAVFQVGDRMSTPVLPELDLDVASLWE